MMVKSTLPRNWETRNLIEVSSIAKSGVRRFHGRRKYVKTGDVSDNEIIASSEVTYEIRPSRANMEVQEGDVLCARMKATEKVILVSARERDNLFSTGFAVLRPKSEIILPEFLMYYLRSKPFQTRKNRVSHGATQKAVNNSDLQKLPVPVPPLDIQKKTVAIMQRADILRRKRSETNQLAEPIIRSAFLKMFGEPSKNPEGWETVTLESVCTDIIDCPHTTPKYVDFGVRLIRTPNIKKGYLDLSETRFISPEEHRMRSRRILPRIGDILYAREATFGNAALVNSDEEFSVGQRIMLLRPDPAKVKGEFLVWMVNSDYVYAQAARVARGATNPHVNVRDVRKFRIVHPPIDLQHGFALIAQKVQNLREKQRQSTLEINRLFHSLMHQAFKGELVA